MNLLPPPLIEKHQKRRLLVRMAVLGAVIFLCLILVVWGLSMTIRAREEQIAVLQAKMEDERFFYSEQIVALLQLHRERQMVQEEIRYLLNLPEFDTHRLDMVATTLPEGVQLLQLTITETEAIITAITADLRRADFHRYSLLETGLVSEVQLDEAIRMEGGTVRYTLIMWWN